jgi:electron transport complex protein RnfC
MITNRKEFLNPAKVYIPLTDQNYKIANVKVNVDDSVLKGQVLAYKFKGKDKFPVVSSVSGKVVEFKEMMDRYGKVVDHCVIQNDMENKAIDMKTYEDASASQIRTALYEVGLDTMNVDGSFTPLYFDHYNIEHLFVNAIFVNEPQYSIEYSFIEDFATAIAEGLGLIAKAALTENITVFVDKEMPGELMEQFGVACVDKNVNFVTIDPKKVNGKELKYIYKTLNGTLGNNILAAGGMYVDIETCKTVYDVIVNGEVPATRNVILSGDGIKSNTIIKTVTGTLLSDMIEFVDGYNEVEEMVCHIGNFLTGQQVTTDEIAVTLTVNAVNFSEYHEDEEDVCIKCGDCNDVCPVGILPQNIMDAELRSVNDRIVELNTAECIECGLCTYVCPSKINVLEWVRRARRRVG